jgi:CDP-diglyceride synthetase
MNNPQINEITPAAKASLRSRLIVAAILIAILVPSFFLGSWVFFFVVGIFIFLAAYELIRAPQKKYPLYIRIVTYVIVLTYVYWFIIKNNLRVYLDNKSDFPGFSLENYFSSLDISIIGIASSFGIYSLIAILDKNFTWEDVTYFFTFTILLGLGFQAAFFCRYYPFYLFGYNPAFSANVWFDGVSGETMVNSRFEYWNFSFFASSTLLFFVLLGTTMNDTFAYFIGSLFGKHKLNERISPHKTWEGFFGGWIFGTLACLIFGFTLAACGWPILPTLTLSTWYWIVLFSLTIPLVADLGDLSFSLIKRRYGIKDYSGILKGHGGIVDRVGSALFTCLYTAIILVFITNGWNFFI